MTAIELQRRADRLVSQEVNACLSSLVATLAGSTHHIMRGYKGSRHEADALAEQAAELSAPVLDYESAAREAGGYPHRGEWLKPSPGLSRSAFRDARDLCEHHDIEPHELEVYEHWAVSSWLAEKLAAKGEKVDTDFAGLNVWARTTTGQAIAADSVILAIVSETGYASGA